MGTRTGAGERAGLAQWQCAFGISDLGTAYDGRPLVAGDLRCWLFEAQALYVSLLGPAPPQSFTQFITTVFDTPQGWKLIGFGTGIGFVFAVLALSLSVVSFPMLLDRPIDAEAIDVEIEHPVVAPTIDVPIAIQTSIKTVLVNPFTMALWGLIVAGSLAIGFLLMFAGLAVVVPVLAHSTWHLYRKVVEPVAR